MIALTETAADALRSAIGAASASPAAVCNLAVTRYSPTSVGARRTFQPAGPLRKLVICGRHARQSQRASCHNPALPRAGVNFSIAERPNRASENNICNAAPAFPPLTL